MKTAQDLENFIKINNVNAKVICGADFSSSEKAAGSLGLKPHNILKTIILHSSKGFLFVYERGDRRISFSKLNSLGFENLRLAHDDEIIKISGYQKGGVPPIDLPKDVIKILDKSFDLDEKVYAGGGQSDCTLEIFVKEIVRLYDPLVQDISQ